MHKISITSIEKTEQLAKALALKSNKGDIFFLKGNLGSGKTTFARFFIKSLAIYNKKKEPKTVVSPTYNLIQDYDCGKKNIVCHIDLYRLKNIKEIENLGFFEEIEDKIALIEWPEKIEKLIKNRIEIIFFHDLKNFDKRTIVIKTFGNNYMNKLNLLKLIKI